jgi:hypothetical protein
MDVMGTLDLSIQGWFINPDDIVRTSCHLLVALPLLLGHHLVYLHLTEVCPLLRCIQASPTTHCHLQEICKREDGSDWLLGAGTCALLAHSDAC